MRNSENDDGYFNVTAFYNAIHGTSNDLFRIIFREQAYQKEGYIRNLCVSYKTNKDNFARRRILEAVSESIKDVWVRFIDYRKIRPKPSDIKYKNKEEEFFVELFLGYNECLNEIAKLKEKLINKLQNKQSQFQ